MIYRPIKKTDFLEVSRVYAECFSAEPWSEPWTAKLSAERILPMLQHDSSRGFVALNGEDVVAAGFGQKEGWLHKEIFLLQELFVHPSFQRRGVGRGLLAYASRELYLSDGIDYWYLLTDRGTPAQAFYESLGFEQSARKMVMSIIITNCGMKKLSQ